MSEPSANAGFMRRPPTVGGKLLLTLAISDYDHVRDLTSGVVPVEGVELVPLTLQIEEIFYRFTRHREWDVSEMSMGKYVSLVSQNDPTIAAIPVFPSRIFRHSSIFVRRDGPVKTPGDLAGRRVGVPEWAQTASVYSRGALVHEYGVSLADIEWVQAGVNQPGRVEKVALNLPPGVRLRPVPAKNLDDMLRAGELDAVFSAHPPDSFERGEDWIARLFPDYRPVEEAYYRKTGIFPIMHVIALRRAILDEFPWAAMNLFTAFEEAKRRSIARMHEVTAPRAPIPFVYDHAARAAELFGPDPFPYGIERNRTTLDAFLQYAHEQGVCHRRVAPEELFPEQMSGAFKI